MFSARYVDAYLSFCKEAMVFVSFTDVVCVYVLFVQSIFQHYSQLYLLIYELV